jgi:hypothetical protein
MRVFIICAVGGVIRAGWPMVKPHLRSGILGLSLSLGRRYGQWRRNRAGGGSH